MQRFFSRTLSVARIASKTLRSDERGSVLAYMVVIPALAGALAIGVETGELYRIKRQMQTASDDAALAGAIDSMASASLSTITTDARYEAQRNGFTHGANGVTVTVNSPPTSGPNVGTTGAVEVIVSKTQNLTFGSIINSWMGRTSSGYTLASRSVAGQNSTTTSTTTTTTKTTSVGCLVALTPNNEQGISFTSFSSFNADCMMMSNGTATGTGSNASIGMSGFSSAMFSNTANGKGGVWSRGTFSAQNYGSLTIPAGQTLVNQTTAIVDPYASIATPTPGACTQTNYKPSGGSQITLSPGNYCNGLQISSFSNVYFLPGTYYITNGDLVISSDSTVSCPTCTGKAGTTFVLTQTSGNNNDIGGVKITSQSTVTLNAPSMKPEEATPAYQYPGILFYQDRRAPVGTMNSTSRILTLSSLSTATLTGAIYVPNNAINIASISSTGSNSSTGCTVWIGRYIKFSSYSSNYVNGCNDLNTTPAGFVTTTTQTSQATTNKGKILE
ncbi:MAG: hypothetical protein JSR47_22245 [Proteobacteria bacterium]|nr:hypothetical protein [Pseudomonadota bacterium]